jgi:methanogen homoaconitase small subunit
VDGERYPARPLSAKMVAILRAGGLVPYWRSRR